LGRDVIARRRRAYAGAARAAHRVRVVCVDRGQSHNLTEFAGELDRGGYRPGKFWAPAIVLTQLVAGPMLALGLFTRLAACPIVLFLVVTDYERWRAGGFFWNKMGLEFTLPGTAAAFYFLLYGGGAISVDHLVIGREF
jgi:putative oxidoreductase